VYTVKHAAALTGISPATLRMWERRYGVVTPGRSPAGYRVYDDAAVQRLIAMRALVTAGWAPRLAAGQVMSGTTLGPTNGTPPSAIGAGDLDVLARMAAALDSTGLDLALDEAFARAEFEEVVDDWLMPALVRLGQAWHDGVVPVAGEHLVSAAVHRRLAAVMEAAPASAGPSVIIGLARGSRHELGVLAFATAVRRAGVGVDYLGSDLPPDSWVVSVSRTRPAAVVLAVPSSDDVPAVRDTVAALAAARPDLPIFLGGRHQDQVEVGGTPLGHRVSAAAVTLVARLEG
jgi:MerR family transcriptional regulator, light-induced transcriptional regulator